MVRWFTPHSFDRFVSQDHKKTWNSVCGSEGINWWPGQHGLNVRNALKENGNNSFKLIRCRTAEVQLWPIVWLMTAQEWEGGAGFGELAGEFMSLAKATSFSTRFYTGPWSINFRKYLKNDLSGGIFEPWGFIEKFWLFFANHCSEIWTWI